LTNHTGEPPWDSDVLSQPGRAVGARTALPIPQGLLIEVSGKSITGFRARRRPAPVMDAGRR
jgi:hypothetical protein